VQHDAGDPVYSEVIAWLHDGTLGETLRAWVEN
jgi:hypothetical protein